jgi:hypothetical protein
LGLKRALAWDKKAALIELTSVDIEPRGSLGEGGKRSPWNLIFGVPETNQVLLVSIRDSKITNVITSQQTVTREEAINSQEVIADSTDVIEVARKRFGLKPGKNWAKGYHFLLLKSEGHVFLGVVGLNPEGKFTKIWFDAKTGKYLGMMIKSE